MKNVILGYEYEIVRWVRKNYPKLGYDKIIEENSKKFPDFVMLKNGQKTRVEVEIYASYFLKHKHDPDGVDEVLCIINDTNLPVRTIEIEQLKLWHHLEGDKLVDFFKATPDSLLVNHRTGDRLYHFQDDWLSISKKQEKSIRKGLNMEAKVLKKKSKTSQSPLG